MELFRAVLELMGSAAMLFVAGSLCWWGPATLSAIRRVERQNNKGWMDNLDGWKRHLDLELRKAKALTSHLQSMMPPEREREEKDVN